MSGVRIVLAAAVFLAGCAKGHEPDQADGRTLEHPDGDPSIDAKENVDAGPEPDAPPHIDAPPAPDAMVGCTVQTVQLLTNQNFDAGTAPWTESAPFPIIGAAPAGVTAMTAPNVAWFGGYDDGNDRMYQDVPIPASATAITLTGYLWVDTEEAGGVYDTASLDLLTTGDTLLANLGSWDNNDAAGIFIAQTLPSPSAFPGQTVRVNFQAATDSSLLTSFFFDSMQLQVTVCE